MNKTKSPSVSLFQNPWLHRAALAVVTTAMALGALPVKAVSPAPNIPVLTTLVTFNGNNGSAPIGKLAQTPDGTFYGTTSTGGTNGGYGTIFKISGGNLTSLFSFNNNNGYQPNSGMSLASDGNFYGTTHLGGIYAESTSYDSGYGTIFRFGTNGSFTSLVSFNGTNGYLPNSLVQAKDGFFYGLAQEGGSYTDGSGLTAGTVFKCDTNGNLTHLLDFNGTNGANPICGLTLATNGTLYGVTIMADVGGATQTGTTFQLTTNGNLTVLDYLNQTNGNQPECLILGGDGNFYGVCAYGGMYGCGIVFQMKPDGTFTTLATFNGTNGAGPQQLIQATDGNFYGVAGGGGAYGEGTVFQCTTNGTLTNLYSFTGNADGRNPSSIMQAKDGNFYGTATYGGNSANGTIFKLALAPVPQIINATVNKNTHVITVNFVAASGFSYNIQHKATLNLDVWTNLTTVTATNSVGVVTNYLGTNNLGFYRVGLIQ